MAISDVGFDFDGTDYWNYSPDSEFGMLRGGGFSDQPEFLGNSFIFEQMERDYTHPQMYTGFRLVRRLEY